MKTSTPKQSETKITQLVQPVEPSGSVKIAGERVPISVKTVPSKSGSSPKTILEGLKEVSKKSLFPFPALTANE